MKTLAYLLLLVLLAFMVLEEANAEKIEQPQSDQPRKKGEFSDKKNPFIPYNASLNSLGI